MLGSTTSVRTKDLTGNNRLLYQLSYHGIIHCSPSHKGKTLNSRQSSSSPLKGIRQSSSRLNVLGASCAGDRPDSMHKYTYTGICRQWCSDLSITSRISKLVCLRGEGYLACIIHCTLQGISKSLRELILTVSCKTAYLEVHVIY